MNPLGLLSSRAFFCCVVVFVLIGGVPFSSNAQLDPSFYSTSCPNVSSIVRGVLTNVSQTDPRMLASLLRVHFHDCFVQVNIYLLSSIPTPVIMFIL